MKKCLGLIVFFSLFSPCSFSAAQRPAVVIIIDDLGYSQILGQRALALPAKVTLSFLPHRPNTPALAEAAHQLGHEVMLHAPMSNLNHHPLGAGALTEGMNQQQFLDTFRAAIASVPHARGVNNHMGSLLTQRPGPMAWLMQELKQQQLYFIDSRTSVETVAAHQAKTYAVPHLSRQVFLDHHRNTQAIIGQFERLLKIASQEGLAIAIGHPYPETLSVLEQVLPTLTLRGYQVLLASEALAESKQTCPALAPFFNGQNNSCRTTLQVVKNQRNRQNL